MTGRANDLPFDLAPFVALLGLSVVEHARRVVDEAPPLTEEQRLYLGPLLAYGVRAAAADREAAQGQDPAA